MFNNKKEDGKTKNMSQSTSGSTNSLNSLVNGTTIEGTIHSESDIRIDGTIQGKLFCDAKVIIGPSGKITGEVNCSNAVIEGVFDGTIQVKENLIIREKAVISGDVSTDKLVVAAGAVFNVNCNMGGTPPASNKVRSSGGSTNTPGTKTSDKKPAIG